MMFYVNYIYKGNIFRDVLPYESYIVTSTPSGKMTRADLSIIRESIVDYMKDLFNLEDDDIEEEDVVIRNWKELDG